MRPRHPIRAGHARGFVAAAVAAGAWLASCDTLPAEVPGDATVWTCECSTTCANKSADAGSSTFSQTSQASVCGTAATAAGLSADFASTCVVSHTQQCPGSGGQGGSFSGASSSMCGSGRGADCHCACTDSAKPCDPFEGCTPAQSQTNSADPSASSATGKGLGASGRGANGVGSRGKSSGGEGEIAAEAMALALPCATECTRLMPCTKAGSSAKKKQQFQTSCIALCVVGIFELQCIKSATCATFDKCLGKL